MLLYDPFWMFMGFILHIYIIFGTNLLTGGPARIAVFFAYFSISKKRNTKWSPNGIKLSRWFFLDQTTPRRLGVQVRRATRRPQGWRARPLPHALLVDPLTCTPSLPYCFLSKNNFSEGFIPFGLRLIFLFFETTKQGKNRNWHWALG